MGHPHGHFVETGFGSFLQDFVHQGDGGFAAFEAEAFLADIFGLQKCLKGFGLVEFAEYPQLVVVAGFLVGNFEAFLEPFALCRFLDVHVFDADGAAVGVAQYAQDFAEQHGPPAAKPAGHKLAVQIPESKPVAFNFQVGVGPLPVFQRVDVSHQVAADTKRVDQFVDAGGFVDRIG